MYKGIIYSVLASLTFGALYFFTEFLKPLNSEQTFAWRMLSTLPFLTLFMWKMGELHYVKDVAKRVFCRPQFVLMLILSSVLCTTQLWLFLWGPMNGRGLQVSLGYFLLPLVMVLVGCIVYKEKLTTLQLVAVVLAVLGVGHEIWRIGSVAWETLYVALAYPLYFFLRKKMRTDHLGGFWWDIALILPVAVALLSFMPSSSWHMVLDYSHLIWAIIGLGLLSAFGLGSYILASRYLSFILFGLLSYLEPILLALASMSLGERIQAEEWWTYGPIWLAVMMLMIEGTRHVYLQKKRGKL